jgi:hypothetical protein
LTGRLAVFTAQLGAVGETFIRRHIQDLALVVRRALCISLSPVVWLLFRMDRRPSSFDESTLVVGLSAAAVKPA